MTIRSEPDLSRRERQVMDVIYRRGGATAREVWEELAEAPSYSTVRTILGVLVEKNQLTSRSAGRALHYTPVRARSTAAKGALRRLVDTFFEGSVEDAVLGLIDLDARKLDPEQVERLREAIEKTRKEIRKS